MIGSDRSEMQGPAAERERLLEAMVSACLHAGEAIMAVYATDFAIETKKDASPVTQADRAAEAIILQALAEHAPGIPVVAEEEAEAGRLPEIDGLFFLVDPLDGTREFVARRGDFTVNLALVENRAPTLGVVLAPSTGALFVGDVEARRAWQATVAADGTIGAAVPLRVRPMPEEGVTAVVSRSHGSAATEAYLDRLTVAHRVARGSSLKICLVAAGQADIYPRLGRTCEWDVAAGDAVLRAAGGVLLADNGEPMLYGKPRFRNGAFIAIGDGAVAPPLPRMTGDGKEQE